MKRVLSFCFDDGFRTSADTVRRLFDERGLSACFCVLAAPQLTQDPFIRASPVADWSYWREAAAAGHEVAPHGYAHERLDLLTTDEACATVQRTWDIFERQLPSFDRDRSLFHIPYLSAPEPTARWIAGRCLGVRMKCGRDGVNDVTEASRERSVDCVTFRPPDADRLACERLERFLETEEGWLVMVLHGLDGEGWGTVAAATLAGLVDRARESGVLIAPPNAVIRSSMLR